MSGYNVRDGKRRILLLCDFLLLFWDKAAFNKSNIAKVQMFVVGDYN
jgi:hypothetical protein